MTVSFNERSRQKMYQVIHEILLNNWDPLTVKHKPQARDEYDAFVEMVYSLIEAHASEDQIYEQLKMIAQEDLGVKPGKELDNSSRQAARQLFKLTLIDLN